MADPKRSAGEMVKMFSEDPALLKKLKSDPLPVLKDTATKAEAKVPAYFGDKSFYYIVVGVLGAVILIAAISSVWLALRNMGTPSLLVALGSAAVGALAGLFAHSPLDQQ